MNSHERRKTSGGRGEGDRQGCEERRIRPCRDIGVEAIFFFNARRIYAESSSQIDRFRCDDL